jgi:hypothetical protein
LNNAVFWSKANYDKLLRDVIPKEPYITASVVSEKLKINVSFARQAIRELLNENKLAPATEYHSRFSSFVKTANFVAPVVEKKADTKKGGETQKGEKPAAKQPAEKK